MPPHLHLLQGRRIYSVGVRAARLPRRRRRMSLYSRLKPKGRSGFGYGTTAEEVVSGLNLAGKTILITGCNSGLGQEAMRVLAGRGATVIGTARSIEKAKAACAAVS